MKTMALLLLGSAVAATGDGEADVILAKVAQKYASLRMYSLKAHNVLGDDIEVDPLVSDMELTFRDGSHFFYVVRTAPSIGPLTIVRDGETVWTYNAFLREYMEEPGDIGGVKRGSSYGVGIFARANASLVARYAHLTNFSATSRLAARQTLRDKFFQGETIVVEVRPAPDARDQGTEQIWIDPRTNLIVRSVVKKQGFAPSTFHYTYRLVNEPIPDEFFAFRPPRNARRVNQFMQIPRPLH